MFCGNVSTPKAYVAGPKTLIWYGDGTWWLLIRQLFIDHEHIPGTVDIKALRMRVVHSVVRNTKGRQGTIHVGNKV